MLRRPSPKTRRAFPTRFLIYTLKIRNRRKPKRISHLHFSNLYKSWAFFIMLCCSAARSQVADPSLPPPLPASRYLSLPTAALIYGSGINSRMRRASLSPPSPLRRTTRAVSRPAIREPWAKSKRILIYRNGINFFRKSLKTKGRHHA